MQSILPPLPDRISLTNFTQRIAYYINGREGLTNVWVIAEITDLSMRGNGHGYCTLIEKDASGRSIASLRATIWQNDFRMICNKFLSATGQNLASGMKVSLQVSASMHPLYGLSANVRDIDPSYTLGDMERIRREILARLQKEGIYDRNKSVSLDSAPQKIAIISAEGAAGYGDFMRQLEASPFSFYTLLYPAAMQGDRTVPGVMAALDKIEETIDFWDCVVIIRGGGATNDLNSFDNLELARRVATYPLPVIVGIGHERDNTVLDYIAHTRCKTPTAVAAFLIDRLSGACDRVDQLMRALTDSARRTLNAEREHLGHKESIIPLLANRLIEAHHRRIERLQTLLSQSGATATARALKHLNEIGMRLTEVATRQIGRQRGLLDSRMAVLRQAAMQRVKMAGLELDNRARLIAVLNPDATLRRGYSITRVNGKALRSVKDIEPGTLLTTTLPDGSITSTSISSTSR